MDINNPVIGTYDFRTVSTKGYYVDKTDAIQYTYDLKDGGAVVLFNRPRRFGTSLMLSMVVTFFNEALGDTSNYFSAFRVASTPYFELHNTLPVIHLDFKNCAKGNPSECLEATFVEIRNSYLRFPNVQGDSLNPMEKAQFRKIKSGNATEFDYGYSMELLIKAIHLETGKKPLLLLDEYDAQMNDAFQRGFLSEISSFFRSFFGTTLKGNTHLRSAIVTGVLPFASESLSSGWNSFRMDNGVYSVFPTECIAFTEKDILKIKEDYHSLVDVGKLREWYGNFRYGDSLCFNPWSIINFFASKERFLPYWGLTGSDTIIKAILGSQTMDLDESPYGLYLGKKKEISGDFAYSYEAIGKSTESTYIFLLSSGYLSANLNDMDYGISVYVPNIDVRLTYRRQLLDLYKSHGATIKTLPELKDAFLEGDTDFIQTYLNSLLKTMSFKEYGDWKVYQSLMGFLCSLIFDDSLVDQEFPSGDGVSDIFIDPKEPSGIGFVIEVKCLSSRTSEQRLNGLAKTCLNQIIRKKYYERHERKGLSQIHLYGIAFSGKRCAVLHDILVKGK